MSYILMIR